MTAKNYNAWLGWIYGKRGAHTGQFSKRKAKNRAARKAATVSQRRNRAAA